MGRVAWGWILSERPFGLRGRRILVFGVGSQFRCEAKRSTRRASRRRGEFVLRPRKRPIPDLFLIERACTLLSPGAALSPRQATHLFLLRQNKVSQKKATLVPASLRCAAGNLRCSAQPGFRSNSLRSDNRGPLSVWASAPRRIHKGLGSGSDSGSGSVAG